MRHRIAGVKLNRTSSHRNAMFRNMVTSLLKHQRIKTTDVKAKELRRWVDHVITLAKRGDLHARRQVLAIVREKDVVHKLFEDAGKRFGNINGGYTRMVKIGPRPGDAATVSLIELVSIEEKPSKKSKTEGKKKVQPAETAPVPAAAKAAPEASPEAAQEQSSARQVERPEDESAKVKAGQAQADSEPGTPDSVTPTDQTGAEEAKDPK